MKTIFLKILPVLCVLGLASSAYSVTIIPTWDSSITSDPSANAITNGIIQAIRVEESNVLDNVTVLIYFQEMTSGLGENSTYIYSPDYSSYLSSLRNSATSLNDLKALNQIPNSSTDPLTGNNTIVISFPMAHLFGFYSGYAGTDGYDSTISLNTSIINFTRPPGNASKYDLIAVCEHEMDEVLGTGSGLPFDPSGPISPEDLCRWSTNLTPSLVLTRTYTESGDNAFFSIDGTNLLARFNMNSGGDYGDWWSATGHWAPPGVTPFVQVQDAFGTPDTTPNLGSNELVALDVMGWTIAYPPGSMKIAPSGKNKYTVSWSGSYIYTLQESTNLLSNNWVNSATGTTNPAVLVCTNKVKFYRLSMSLPTVLSGADQPQGQASLPVQQVTRAYLPSE